MRKLSFYIILSLLLLPIAVTGQTYSTLWKQELAAENKDMPKSQLTLLERIAKKAESEKAYGHLLKATVKSVNVWGSISTDSVQPAIQRLEAREAQAGGDIVLKAVYDAALVRLYRMWNSVVDDSDTLAAKYREAAMERPDKLAAAKATAYEPFVVEGANSNAIFNDDVLSLVGYETEQYDKLHTFYSSVGNRRAACITALEMLKQSANGTSHRLKQSPYIQSLDSLIAEYADLEVAGEVAVERYNAMRECPDVTVEDKIRYIHYALDKWGAWQRIGELRNAERQLTTPTCTVRMDKGLITPNTEQNVRLLNVRNLESVTVNIYKTKLNGDTTCEPMNDNWYKQLKSQMTLLPEKSRTKTFTGLPDYQQFNDSIALAPLPVGVYMVEFVTSPATKPMRGLYRVSDVSAISQSLPDGSTRYAVVNATTGLPIAGAKLRLATHKYDNNKTERTVTLTTDAKGEVVYKWPNKGDEPRVYAYTETDKASLNSASSYQYYFNDNYVKQERTSVFTDRAIYRPGQTVHVAAVVYVSPDHLSNEAIANKKVSARLRDANYQVVSEKELTTDEFGTCFTDFTIPTGKLNGNYTVQIAGGSAAFRVEEYKRPTFRVEFPSVSEKYQNGDTIMVKAKAVRYAGVPVQGARVKYSVARQPAYWWLNCNRWRNNGNIGEAYKVMKEGEATTASDGSFIVEMPMSLPDDAVNTRMFYNFVATADVTDAAGETHHGELSVPLGTRPTSLSCDIPAQVLSDSTRSVTFHLRNAAGIDVSTDVKFRFDNNCEWTTAKTIEPYALKEKFSSGKHTLFALCEGDTLKQEFTAFGLDDTKPCTETDDWFYISSPTFPSDGSPVTVQIGSSANDVHVLYGIYSGNTVIESGSFDLSDAINNTKFTYKESYGDGILLSYAWVKNGQCHTHEETIKRPLPDKHLKLEWTTFRDRLTPGQQETWQLKVTKPDGKPANAQVMATLYDQSLDQIKKHNWRFAPQTWLRTPNTWWRSPHIGGVSMTRSLSRSWLQSKSLDLSRFDSVIFGIYMDYIAKGEVLSSRSGAAQPMLMRSMKVKGVASMAKEENVFAAYNASETDEAAVFDSAMEEQKQSTTAEQLRENLDETAFFFPTLQTDADGNATIKFTLPESLTTWQFIGLAHTADMYYGQLMGEAVAQKTVMVQPNVPRFVRAGDKAKIAARIFNNGENTVNGTARMTLTDPETDKVVYTKDLSFNVEAGQTTAVSFDYQPDGASSLLVCKITASGRDFSDGEQHYLPILPDSERTTVTAPFTQNAAGTKSIDIEKLFPKGSVRNKLTIEYTNNPAWLVVQALPYVGTTDDDNAISLSTALYANAVGRSLANSSPKIKQMFNQWRMEAAEGVSLSSPLENNAELKDIALDETPWMNDADSETEQKKRLADFFDENTMQSRMAATADKLGKLQLADGSWSWWKGMNGSIYMTVEVATTLARMHLLAGQLSTSKAMLDRALKFMDKEMAKKVASMKREEKKGHRQSFPGTTALDYLYIYAIDGRTPTAEAQRSIDYLIGLLKKETKSQTIYNKAVSAIIFAKNHETTLANEYAQSLKEYLVNSEEMGSYYDTRKAAYSWCDYKIPSHVAAMEAIETITPHDENTATEMRRWLLQEKRTQAWDTPINTANAIYAFLRGNTKMLAEQEQATLTIDGQTIDTPKATAGVGYVKTAISQPKGKTFTATKTSEGTSWGALYAQFTQKTTDIGNSNSGINVKREIVSDKKELTVGDRMKVRITIESKRDLDFVQVSDRRAACMEPVEQLSGYRNRAYCSPKDNATYYYLDRIAKGQKVAIETEYYLDRQGQYETGTCTVGCAYAPEYRATAKSMSITVK